MNVDENWLRVDFFTFFYFLSTFFLYMCVMMTMMLEKLVKSR